MRFELAQHINDYRAAVEAEGNDFFKFYEKDGYTVGNYVSIMAKFPNPYEQGISDTVRRHRLLLRDMRGILFGPDGVVISKPLHKFHNLNEGTENQHDKLNWTEFEVYDKLDGSMIRPAIINGEMRWCTKAGITHMTPDVEAFVERNPQYLDLARVLVDLNMTPIFEYMAPKHRIVVDYGPEEKMSLLAIRDNYTGQYATHEELIEFGVEHNIPVVKRWEIKPEDDLLALVDALRNAEGVVIRFPDDHRVKLKADQYVLLHRTRSDLERERLVAKATLEDSIDDLLPLVPEYIQPRLEKYAREFLKAFYARRDVAASELYRALCLADAHIEDLRAFTDESVLANAARKWFSLESGLPDWLKSMGFKLFDLRGIAFTEAFDAAFRAMIIKHAENTDTKFESEVRNRIFAYPYELPTWNIWEHSIDEE